MKADPTATHTVFARQRLRDLGLERSITEMDVRRRLPASTSQRESQAATDRDALAFGRSKCQAVMAWGFTDKYSWIPALWGGAALRRKLSA